VEQFPQKTRDVNLNRKRRSHRGRNENILRRSGLILGLAYGQTATEKNGSRIVLPNPKLLRCKSFDCYQVWLEKSAETNAEFPKQVSIDMNHSCLYGMTALYDKSIPLDDIRAAIDERYRKWAVPEFVNSSIKIWRVEPVTRLHRS
jgi:hypothetical protein